MGQLIEFPAKKADRRTNAAAKPADSTGATVLIFTGVRYEHIKDTGQKRRPAARR